MTAPCRPVCLTQVAPYLIKSTMSQEAPHFEAHQNTDEVESTQMQLYALKCVNKLTDTRYEPCVGEGGRGALVRPNA